MLPTVRPRHEPADELLHANSYAFRREVTPWDVIEGEGDYLLPSADESKVGEDVG